MTVRRALRMLLREGTVLASDTTTDSPSSTPVKRRAGRKRKFAPDQVQSRMVERAVEELLGSGISFGVDAIRIDRVLVLAEVPRGSAYEAWDHPDRTPQENLRHATVLHVLKSTTANNVGPTREHTLELLADLGDDINSGDCETASSCKNAPYFLNSAAELSVSGPPAQKVHLSILPREPKLPDCGNCGAPNGQAKKQ